MPAHVGADTGSGVRTAHGVGGAAFESLHQNRNRKGRRVGDEQVHVVGFAVELDHLTSSSVQTAASKAATFAQTSSRVPMRLSATYLSRSTPFIIVLVSDCRNSSNVDCCSRSRASSVVSAMHTTVCNPMVIASGSRPAGRA